MKRNILIAWILAILISASAFSDGLIVPIRPDLRIRGSWAVKYHKVDIQVHDQIAEVSIDQAFVNTGQVVLEAEYLFPLPPGAAIDGMTLIVDGKDVRGRILRSEEARRIYMEIVRTRRDPALLEYVNYGLYRTSAFPLQPGKEVHVLIHYTDICKKDGDLVEVFYPLNTEKFSARPLEQATINVNITNNGPISSVYSPTHAISIQRPAPNRVLASYSVQKEIPANDFRLLYQPTGGSVGATVLSYRPRPDEDGYFLMMVSPTPRAEKSAPVPKDLVIALDRSGSMQGDKVTQAKSSLGFVLRNLNPSDRFNVIVYNDSIEPVFDEMVSNTREHVDKALGIIDRISAGGSTNIHDALSTSLRMAGAENDKRARYILFLTDGLPTVGITDEGKILKDTAAANSAHARIFAMGIGYDVNVRLLDNLVGQNRGRSSYIKEHENLEPRIASLYNKIKNPVMTDLTVKLPEARPRLVYPQIVPDLFDNDQIVLVGRYARPGREAIAISGTYQGKSQDFEYVANLEDNSQKLGNAFIEQLWAVRRIGYLLDQIQLNGRSEEVVDELVMLSKRYGIITPYTSFLANERVDLASNAELLRQAKASADGLNAAIDGASAQVGAANRAAMNSAVLAPAQSTVQSSGVLMSGNSSVTAYEAHQAERLSTVQAVGNRALYRRGSQWIDSELSDQNVERLNGAAQRIVQFSEEYFRLAIANNLAENQMLASQQPGQDLIVKLRGQVYLIEAAK